jgi:DNA repair protein RadC
MKTSDYATMKGLPEAEKPYEKCKAQGPGALTEAELLAVILRSGTEGVNVLDMSRRILESFGTEGIGGLCSASPSELKKIRGVGQVKALQLVCIAELSRRIVRSGQRNPRIFGSSRAVAEYCREELRHERQEKMMLLMFGARGNLLGEEILTVGTSTRTLLDIRRLMTEVLARRAVNIMLIHNHPDGDPAPSENDFLLTQQISETVSLLEIRLLDHIIIGNLCWFSMREMFQVKFLHPLLFTEDLPETERGRFAFLGMEEKLDKGG